MHGICLPKISFKFKLYLIEILKPCIEYMPSTQKKIVLDTKINKPWSRP